MLGNVAQTFERIGAVVALALDGGVTKFGTAFDKEHKEHAVHVAQAFERQLTRIDRVGIQVAALVVGHVVKDFVAQEFYAFAERVFKVLRDSACVFLAVFVEGVEQNLAIVGAQAFFVEQDAQCLECRFFATGKNFVKFKLQVTLFVPLVSVNQGDLCAAYEQ